MDPKPKEHYALPPETGPMPASELDPDPGQAALFGDCPRCNGSGRVREWVGELPADVRCPECSGSGARREPAFLCEIDESAGAG